MSWVQTMVTEIGFDVPGDEVLFFYVISAHTGHGGSSAVVGGLSGVYFLQPDPAEDTRHVFSAFPKPIPLKKYYYILALPHIPITTYGL